MNAFVELNQTRDIEVQGPSGPNVVTIKETISYADRLYVQNKSARIEGKEIQIVAGDAELAQMTRAIVRWAGPDFVDGEGKPIAVSEAWIRRPRPDMAKQIAAEVGKLFESESEDEADAKND